MGRLDHTHATGSICIVAQPHRHPNLGPADIDLCCSQTHRHPEHPLEDPSEVTGIGRAAAVFAAAAAELAAAAVLPTVSQHTVASVFAANSHVAAVPVSSPLSTSWLAVLEANRTVYLPS